MSARQRAKRAVMWSIAGRQRGSRRSRHRRRASISSRTHKRAAHTPRTPAGWLRLAKITRNNLHGLDAAFPLGCFTTVTGVSGSGKSSLVSQALPELVASRLGRTHRTRCRRRTRSAARRRHAADGRRYRRRHGRDPAARARRPEADRPHAALEPRHLHGPLRSRAQALRRDARRAQAALRRGPLLVQRREGPLPDVRRRRIRQRRTAVPAERLCALLDLPRHALQRADARNRMARQEHRARCWD